MKPGLEFNPGLVLQWKPAYKNTHFRGSGWLGSYISSILGEISLKVFLSVLNFLFLKKM